MNKQTSYLEALHIINAKKNVWDELCFSALFDILSTKNNKKRTWLLVSFLTWLYHNWVTPSEIISMINAIAKFEWKNFYSDKLDINKNVISIVWSGKKGLKTFNISTCASLVAATCWASVAKIWSSATSALTGSRDILWLFGADLNIWNNKMIEIINTLNFWFFSIENCIPKFDKTYWWIFYVPHALSYILPALTSPIQLSWIVYWLSWKNIEISKELLIHYNIWSFSVVSSNVDNIHFIDEISWIWNTNIIRHHKKQINYINKKRFFDDLWITSNDKKIIQQWKNKQENMKNFIQAISNSWDIYKNYIIALNAAELLLASNIVNSFNEGFQQCLSSIKNNQPLILLENFINATWWKFRYHK